MDKVSKYCDLKVRRQGADVACGKPVPGDEPTPVTLDNVRYLMDLCDEHKEKLHVALQPFISVASDVQKRLGTHVRKAVLGSGGKPFTTKDVRKWLQDQGRDVPPKGRLPEDLLREYEEAHS